MKIQQIPHAIYTTAKTAASSFAKGFVFCLERIFSFGKWVCTSLSAIRDRFSRQPPQPIADQVGQAAQNALEAEDDVLERIDQMAEEEPMRVCQWVKPLCEPELDNDGEEPAEDPLALAEDLLDKSIALRQEQEMLLRQLGQI